jgi:uncharacterized membrane protein
MSENKTMPAALAELLRPRRMARVRRTVARSRADGAWFDAVFWSVFSAVAIGVLLYVVNVVDERLLTSRGLDKDWLVACAVLVAVFVAGTLWWRWFKWHVHAVDLTQQPRPPGPR